MKIKINVTARDIEKGHPLSPTYCPIAIAASRVLSKKNLYATAAGMLRIKRKKEALALAEIEFPTIATNFIRYFDSQEPVKPFSFTIEVPDEILNSGN